MGSVAATVLTVVVLVPQVHLTGVTGTASACWYSGGGTSAMGSKRRRKGKGCGGFGQSDGKRHQSAAESSLGVTSASPYP